MNLSNIHVVLLRTRNAMNLGAVARAMKNFGLARLTLVAPETQDLATARAVAVHAEDILERMRTAATLAEAVADARWIVGTSQRGLPEHRALDVDAFADLAHARSHEGELALVFGDEQSGLSRADLLACHDVSSIPAEPEQGSLNLAQAAVVYAHALHARSGRAEPEPVERAGERELAQVESAIRGLLEASAFAEPDRRGHGVAELAHSLRRAGLSPAEARLWQAALRGAERRLRTAPK